MNIAQIRSIAASALHFVPVQVWRTLFPQAAIGLCYHAVSDRPLPHVKHYPVITTRQFENDLDYLQKVFNFISYEHLILIRSGSSEQKNAAILTFDDGFAECASVIAPILIRRGLSCVFFVITDHIDNRHAFRESKASLCIHAVTQLPKERVDAAVRTMDLKKRLRPLPKRVFLNPAKVPLDIADFDREVSPHLLPLIHWLLTLLPNEESLLDELSELLGVDSKGFLHSVQPYLTTQQIRHLQELGFTIGAHSLSHRLLQNLSQEEAECEIVSSCEIVRSITGEESVPFAFPYYGAGIDRTWLGRLRSEHKSVGLFFDTGGLRKDEPFVVPNLKSSNHYKIHSVRSVSAARRIASRSTVTGECPRVSRYRQYCL